MKKLTFFICAIFLTTIGYSQGIETFENIGSPSGSYGTRTWTGDNGASWHATQARTDRSINGKAITVNNGELSTTIYGGIGDLTLTTQRQFSGGSGTITVYIDGTPITETFPYDGSVQTKTISVNASGNIALVLEPSGDRVAMDDLTWTSHGGSGNTGPLISNISQLPSDASVTSSDDVTVSADIIDSDGIASAKLYWGTTSGALNNNAAMTSGTGDSYSAVIPSYSDETTVYYEIQAIDSNSEPITAISGEQSYTVADPIPFTIPYSNAFGNQSDYDEAVGYGFEFNDASQNGSYVRIISGSIISPAIDFSAYNSLTVSFGLGTYGGSNGQELSVSVSDDNGASYTVLGTFAPTSSSLSPYEQIVDLTSLNSTNGRIKFEQTGGTASLRFNALTVEETPICLEPTALTATNITASTADISWTAGDNEGSWKVKYSNDPDNFDPMVDGTAISPDPTAPNAEAQLTGLSGGTTYKFYVKAHCGENNESDWVASESFTTPFAPVQFTSFENSEGFQLGQIDGQKGWSASDPTMFTVTDEDASDGTQSVKIGINPQDPPAYRTLANNFEEYTSGRASFSADIKISNYNGGATEITAVGGGITTRLSFQSAPNRGINDLSALVLDKDSGDPTGATATVAEPINDNEWINFNIVYDFVAGDAESVEYFINGTSIYSGPLTWGGTTTGIFAIYALGEEEVFIDNIEWAVIPCEEPTDLTAGNYTFSNGHFTADLGWTDNNSIAPNNGWTVEWGAENFSQGNGTSENATGTTFTTESVLDPNTSYDFYVRADCSDNDHSDWAGPFTFTTPCEVVTAPWTEDFESGADGNLITTDLGCWSQQYESNTEDWEFATTNDNSTITPHSGSLMAEFNNTTSGSATKLVTPSLDMSGLTTPELTFYFANVKYSSSFPDIDELRVYYKESASDLNWTLIPGAEYTAEHTSWEEVKLVLPEAAGKTDYVIAFEATSNWARGMDLDDVSVDEFDGYVYLNDNDGWSPENPAVSAGPTDDVIIMNGTATFSSNVEANNITVESGATLNVEAALKINGDITADGNMVFKSTANYDGELDVLPNGSTITGDVTVERYTSDQRAFRYVSSAVNTSDYISDNWQQNTHITGSLDGSNGFDITQSGNPSMFTLNVGTQAFDPIDNTDNTKLNAGDPYMLYVRGDRSIDLTDNSSHGSTVLKATGELHTGPMTQSFSGVNNGEFVDLGNPYQSVVDLSSVIGNSTGVKMISAYVYDPTLGSMGAYVTVTLADGSNSTGTGAGSSEADQYLQPGQAVQVEATGGSVDINFAESDKAPGMHTETFSNDDPFAHITGRLFTAENHASGGPLHDSFNILFNDGFDNALNNADAVKPFNFTENMGIGTLDNAYSIERRQLPVEGEDIALFNANYENQEYTLVFKVSEFANATPYLVDTYTGEQTELEAGENVIDFTVDSSLPGSVATDRFYIHFGPSTLSVEDQTADYGIELYPNPARSGNGFYVTAGQFEGQNVNVSITDLLGKTVYSAQKRFADGKVNIQPDSPLGSGVYFVRLAQDGKTVNKRLVVK